MGRLFDSPFMILIILLVLCVASVWLMRRPFGRTPTRLAVRTSGPCGTAVWLTVARRRHGSRPAS